MKPSISNFRFMTGVSLAAVLLLNATRSQGAGPTSVVVDIPVAARTSGEKTNSGGESRTLLLVNLAALRRVVFKPEDVLEASLQIALRHAPAGGSLSVYALRPSVPETPFTLDHFEHKPMRALQAHEFHPGSNLSTAVRVAEVRGIGEILRAGLATSEPEMQFLVVASPKFPDLEITGTTAHVTIVSHPKATLFSPPVEPRADVYVEDRNGHLFYGGQRLRLWGCVRPQLPNAETADRIANMGFNAIRMWGPRAIDFPDGHSPLIDDDTGEFMASSRGDGSPLDEYDRFYAETKRAGLFIMSTGLTDNAHASAKSRWLAGGGEHWKEWQEAMASKPDVWILNFMAAVDDRLLQAREKQAKDYLTHVNPYTGKAYAEEEAIAIFELENENAHVKRTLEKGFDKWPPFFVSELQQRWNE